MISPTGKPLTLFYNNAGLLGKILTRYFGVMDSITLLITIVVKYCDMYEKCLILLLGYHTEGV